MARALYVTCAWWFLSPAEETIVTNVAAGVVSGALSSAIANPTDVLKVKGCQ